MDVAETLAAMANADGGELAVGIENDGTVTGVSVQEDRMLVILTAPQSRNYYPPTLTIVGSMSFQATLRSQAVYDRATLEWLRQFDTLELSLDQKRILAFARAHGDRFTSRDVQNLLRTDIYGASALIKELMRKGAARSPAKGSRVYGILPPLQARADTPAVLAQLLPTLNRRGHLRNGDLRKELQVARNTASRLLQEWTEGGWLVAPRGKRGLGALYRPGPRLLHQSRIAPSVAEAGAMAPVSGAMDGNG